MPEDVLRRNVSRNVEDLWLLLEEIENSWFSLWSDTKRIKYALILYNRVFKDDPIFNHATEIRCQPQESYKMIEHVNRIFEELKIRPCFYISPFTTPKDLLSNLVKRGFQLYDRLLVMQLTAEASAKLHPHLVIEEVGEEDLGVWANVFVEAFDAPASWSFEVVKRAKFAMKRGARHLLAKLRGSPVGTLSLYSHKDIAGIYNVATLQRYRRHGVATSLMHRAISESRRMGDELISLQTLRKDGLVSFYRRLGFTGIYSKEILIRR